MSKELKRIQLRGISRTPSDRMTDDGGVAESLNIQLQDQENVPVLRPKVLKSINDGEFVYIHKTTKYTNYIIKNGNQLMALYGDSTTPSTILTIDTNDEILDVNSIGNTLIVAAGKSMYYILYKDLAYHILGGNITFPNLKFTTTHYNYGEKKISTTENVKTGVGAYTFLESVWHYQRPNIIEISDDDKVIAQGYYNIKEIVQQIESSSDVWADYYQSYNWGVFAVYSIVLYDDSEIASEPYFITDKTNSNPLTARGVTTVVDGDHEKTELYMSQHNLHTISLMVMDNTISAIKSNWSDIVKSVRIYLSQDVRPERYIKNYSTAKISGRNSSFSGNKETITANISLYGDSISEENFTNSTVFNMVNEYSLDEFAELSVGAGRSVSYFNNTDRSLKPILDITTMLNRHLYRGKHITIYNNRVILTGVTKKYCSGPSFIAGSMHPYGVTVPETTMTLTYFVHSMHGSTVKVSGGTWKCLDGTTNNAFVPVSYLVYPNNNCYKVGINVSSESYTDYYEIPMREHPSLPVSFFYYPDNPSLLSLLNEVAEGNSRAGIVHYDVVPADTYQLEDDLSTYVCQSDTDNFYLMRHFLTFVDEIVGIATTTRAISTGQFGQFPLYAFTQGGIYTISLDDEGNFKTCNPLSRDVALNNTICPIDQAVVFCTDLGVMLLQSSDIVCISPDMNGAHYSLEYDALQVLKNTGESIPYKANIQDIGFMDFVRSSKAVYDYANQRLVFTRNDQTFQYVYMINTKTWHKMYALVGGYELKKMNTINSYPDCYVSANVNGKNSILNISSKFNSALTSRGDVLPAIIVTRPFSLGADDSFKSISDIHIRGNYKRIVPQNKECDIVKVNEFQTTQDNVDLINAKYPFLKLTLNQMHELSGGTIDSIGFETVNGENPDDILTYINSVLGGNEVSIDINSTIPSYRTVRYLLLGSNDGINFTLLHSLRGQSWKLFRLVIVGNLKPTDRISWVDVEYERRFTNKLR